MAIALEYKPIIAWRTIAKNVRLLQKETEETPAIYRLTVSPVDRHEIGAGTANNECYFISFMGNPYTVTDANPAFIDVRDDFRVGVAPTSSKTGIIYKSVDGSPFIAPVYYRFLHYSALENMRKIEISILWQYSQLSNCKWNPKGILFSFNQETNTLSHTAGKLNVNNWNAQTPEKRYNLDVVTVDGTPVVKPFTIEATDYPIATPDAYYIYALIPLDKLATNFIFRVNKEYWREKMFNGYITVIIGILNSESDNRLLTMIWGNSKNKTDWTEITNKPTTFSPSAHEHEIADVTGLQTALNNKINTSLIGVANGLAETDANNFVKNIHLPGYIDDVIDGFLISSTVFDAFETPHNPGGPVIPEGGKIYFDVYTNLQYRWSGTAFITTNSALALGETAETAYRGDRGKIAYDYSQIGHLALTDSRISQWEAAYTARINSLTNVGNSGQATLIGNVLNIPNYTLAGLGGAPAFSGTANYIPKFGSSGTTLENSQLSQSVGDYMILDNQYAGILFKKSGVNKFIFGDDQFLTATRPDAYGFYLYGDNVIDFWTNNTRIATFGQSSGIQFPSLAGTGMRLTTSSSNGTLANISNATGYLANDGSGNMSFGAITGFLPITGGELTGGLIGTTANFSGAATAASFIFGSTGYSFEVVADRLVVKKNGIILDALDSVGNRKIAGDGYGGGV